MKKTIQQLSLNFKNKSRHKARIYTLFNYQKTFALTACQLILAGLASSLFRSSSIRRKSALPILGITIAVSLAGTPTSQAGERLTTPRFCQPRTRCTDYEVCYINNISQPCAWGRGGATLSAIFFKHGTFYLEWLSKDDMEIIYGDKKQFKTNATLELKDGQRIYMLTDGVTFQHPSWTIPLHLVGEEPLP